MFVVTVYFAFAHQNLRATIHPMDNITFWSVSIGIIAYRHISTQIFNHDTLASSVV